MSRFPETRDRSRTLSPLSVVSLVVLGLLWWARLYGMSLLERLTGWASTTTRWSELPWPLGLLTILTYRDRLRRENLYDTESATAKDVPAPEDTRYLTARTADGTYNDLENPRMGSAGTRFGRNVPPARTYPDNERLMQPNPRTVSRELLTRRTLIPAESLNLLAASWIQFMLHDWLSHGPSPKDNPWEVPLHDDDEWPESPMRTLRTKEDPTRTPQEE